MAFGISPVPGHKIMKDMLLVLYGEQEKSNNSAEIQDPPLYFYDSTTSTSKQPITDKMAEGDEHINFPIFRDCLSSPLIQKSAAEPPKINRKARGRGGRKTAIKPVRTIVSSDEPNDAEELADFIDYVAREVYSSLPEDLRSLTYSTYINSKSLQASYAIPLATKTSSSILDCLPLSVGDSLSTYGMLPESTTPTELITPILNSYLDIVTTPPPLPHLTRQLATECETCLRSWIPLTFHHLIPRGVHAKALKRGWHTEDQLNNVAWLCRACHSFVHKVATHEELAKDYYTVDLLMEREDVVKFSAWVGKVRWKSK